MELTIEHYVLIGFSFVIGFLLAFVFIRINYVRNLAKLETTANMSNQRQVKLENQLSAKEIELNSIRKQTVELMQNEADLKNKAKTGHKVQQEKEALLEKMKTDILSGLAAGASPGALTETTSLKGAMNPVGIDNSSIQKLDEKLSALISNANTKLDRMAVMQGSISKDTAALLGKDSQINNPKQTPSLDIEAMKKASVALEKVVFSESEEFIETAV